MNRKVTCPYCGGLAALVKGDRVYPHRRNLWARWYWQCPPCNAHVGCHEASPQYGEDGTRPLGRLANPELRLAKIKAHGAFDPLWRSGVFTRRGAYEWLAKRLGIPRNECHIGMFDEAMCQRVVEVCSVGF